MPVYTYTTLDDPSAINNTQAFGINASGQIVGSYSNASGIHGFLYSNGTYTALDDPLATGGTLALGINDLGQIVGEYVNATGTHGFLRDPISGMHHSRRSLGHHHHASI